MQYFRKTAQETLRELESDAREGLAPEKVAEHRAKYGKNEFTRAGRKTLWRRVWEAATEPMLILLFFAWVITVAVNVVNATQGEPFDYYECVGILVAIAVSVVLTVVMEGRSAKAFEELNKIKEGAEIKVVRGGVCNEGEYLLAPLRKYVGERLYVGCDRVPLTINRAALGNDAGIYGALAFAMD